MGNCKPEKTNVDQGEFYGKGPSVNRIQVLFGMLAPLENTSSRDNVLKLCLYHLLFSANKTNNCLTQLLTQLRNKDSMKLTC